MSINGVGGKFVIFCNTKIKAAIIKLHLDCAMLVPLNVKPCSAGISAENMRFTNCNWETEAEMMWNSLSSIYKDNDATKNIERSC